MNDEEFEKTIGRIAKFNPSNSDIYTVEMAQFVATFERVAMPPEFKVCLNCSILDWNSLIYTFELNSISFLFPVEH